MRSRTPGAFSQLSAFASAFLYSLLLPGMPQIGFSPWRLTTRISRAWNSGEQASYRYLPPRTARLAGCWCLARGMPALDCGNFCADLSTEGLAFVGMPGRMLRSKAGCKGAIVRIAAARHRTEGRAVPFIKTESDGASSATSRHGCRCGEGRAGAFHAASINGCRALRPDRKL